MKRFLITAAVLAVTFVVLWVDFLPVRCSHCEHVLFRTDITSMLFGGHGEIVDLCAPADQTTTAIANGNLETQAEGTAEESHS